MRVRDDSVDIAKGICMLFIVANHSSFAFGDMRTINFNIPTFYFISGFFLYKYIINDGSKYEFICKKFKSLMAPYFAYNILFGVVTYILMCNGVNSYKSDLPIFSVHNMLVEPFFSGVHFQIHCAMWFVPSLFLVMMLVCMSKKILRFFFVTRHRIIVLIVMLIAIYYISTIKNYEYNKYLGVISRTFIGFSLCILGCLYYKYKNIVHQEYVLAFSVIIYALLQLKFGPLSYISHLNIYGSGWHKLVALPAQLSGVFIVVSLSSLIYKYRLLMPENIFVWFGRNSFHVMAIHLSSIVVINVFICILSKKALSDLNGILYMFDNIHFMYFFFSIFYCYFIIKYASILWGYIKKRLSESGTPGKAGGLFL